MVRGNKEFTKSKEGAMIIGLDLHCDYSYFTAMREDGATVDEVHLRGVCPTRRRQLGTTWIHSQNWLK